MLHRLPRARMTRTLRASLCAACAILAGCGSTQHVTPPHRSCRWDPSLAGPPRGGIGVSFTLTGPAPLWAAGRGAPRGAPYGGGSWKPSARAFGDFVHAMATRYDGRYTPAGSTKPLP